ncbi:hypothetical protein D9742_19140 [Escherichia sp. E1V33]|nr:hypothetical protein D9742_19140 [Escherichia sp. E1V33]TBR66498.1 hypothetical protein D9735_09350 [Escherichia sp. E1S7]
MYIRYNIYFFIMRACNFIYLMNLNKFNLFFHSLYIYFPLSMILNVLFFVKSITRNSDEI